MSGRIDALWIDLGGVVVRDPRPIVVRRLGAGGRIDRNRLRTAYYRLSRALDVDRIDLGTMYERLRRAFGLSQSYREFRDLVCDTSLATIPPVLGALRRLRASEEVRIVLTSNVSREVWNGLERRFRLRGTAHEVVLSFRVRTLKPSARFFREALRRSATGRGRVLFLDDSTLNVRAARRFGVRAHRVTGAGDTVRRLERLSSPGPGRRGPVREGRDGGVKRPGGPHSAGRVPGRALGDGAARSDRSVGS